MSSLADGGDSDAGPAETTSTLSGISIPTARIGDVVWEGLRDGSLLAVLRASAPAGMKLRTDAELDESLAVLLGDWDGVSDVEVFAYGSLMWNPAFHYVEASGASLAGWARQFCIRLDMGRGTVEKPGLMLALDERSGAVCEGIALRVEAAQVREELSLLWRREMLGHAYTACWVVVDVKDQLARDMHPDGAARSARALTFVVDRRSERYLADLSDDKAAELIVSGAGPLGSCASYFQTTLDTLRRLGIDDPDVERLARAVDRRRAATQTAS